MEFEVVADPGKGGSKTYPGLQSEQEAMTLAANVRKRYGAQCSVKVFRIEGERRDLIATT